MLPLTLTLVLFYLGQHAARAGNVTHGGNCSVSSQRLELGTYQFYTECDSMTYCTSSGICEWRGCRRDMFPFGYDDDSKLPPMCTTGSFCPDEEDQCLSLMAVGSPCQFNRDDQCEGPPNHTELADHSGFGLNVNGSVCLNNVCMWANATVGQSCEVQNTAYVAFTRNGHDFADIVSRDNCQGGLYCDSQQLVCMQTKAIGVACSGDKECSTYNCLSSGICGTSADTPRHVAFWVYAVVGVGAFGGTIGTLVGMFFVHKKERQAEQNRRMQYWQEQNALRQGLLNMQRTARDSLLSIAGSSKSPQIPFFGRESVVFDEPQNASTQGMNRSSGLRFSVVEDDAQSSNVHLLSQHGGDKKVPGKY